MNDNVTENNDNEFEGNIRYFIRIRNKFRYFDEYVLEDEIGDNVNYIVDYCYRVVNISIIYDEVVNSFEASKWKKVMGDEIIVLNDNDTYDLVTLSEGR